MSLQDDGGPDLDWAEAMVELQTVSPPALLKLAASLRRTIGPGCKRLMANQAARMCEDCYALLRTANILESLAKGEQLEPCPPSHFDPVTGKPH